MLRATRWLVKASTAHFSATNSAWKSALLIPNSSHKKKKAWPLHLPTYTILYYTILYYTILYYTTLYYTILYYTILYYTILLYSTLPSHHSKARLLHQPALQLLLLQLPPQLHEVLIRHVQLPQLALLHEGRRQEDRRRRARRRGALRQVEGVRLLEVPEAAVAEAQGAEAALRLQVTLSPPVLYMCYMTITVYSATYEADHTSTVIRIRLSPDFMMNRQASASEKHGPASPPAHK